MTAVALVSAKGAPGVSTAALLLAAVWPAPSLLVEADPAGGDLRCWLPDSNGQALRGDVGVVSLLAAHAIGGVVTDRSLLGHAQQLAGGLPVLVGPGSPSQSDVVRGQWSQLAAAIAAHEGDVIVDGGRTDGGDSAQLQLLQTADRVLVVARATISGLARARDLLSRLSQQRIDAQVLLVGAPAARDDAARALGTDVHLLPDDPEAARDLSCGRWSRRLDRSPLLAAGRRIAATLHEQLHPVRELPTSLAGSADPACDPAAGLVLR